MSDACHLIATVVVPHQVDEPLRILNLAFDSLEEAVEDALHSKEIRTTLLLRPSEAAAGLYAHYSTCAAMTEQPNLRATRLVMSCGLFSKRLYGDVIFSRSAGVGLAVNDIQAACYYGPDLRPSIQRELGGGADDSYVPDWIGNASQQNYHDRPVLARLAAAMTEEKGSDNGSESSSCSSSSSDDQDDNDKDTAAGATQKATNNVPDRQVVTKTTLCLHCRRPASTPCAGCGGAFFCDAPRTCRVEGWSHNCLCSNWKLYTDRRTELSTFPLGEWHTELVVGSFQSSEEPYEHFLARLGITKDTVATTCSWWRTEMDGWSGGESESAKTIDVTIRRSYAQGFHPLTTNGLIPPERRVSDNDIATAGLAKRNELGFLRLQSWEDYYKLRGIDKDSPAALLLTFPISLYYFLVEFGQVPCTVARMLKRPLRIHIVGAEKEINFLDLFREVAFILPENFDVELVFVVRQDMLPPSLRSDDTANHFAVQLTCNLRVVLVSGTYGGSLDPNFDCGSGPPDMVMAFNAGIYAYESWRSVVDFLERSTGVVGVFSDYNEYSGVQCASLGGASTRASTQMCPFRQPRAMPVFSMDLPQFSNGFLYVFNAQELD